MRNTNDIIRNMRECAAQDCPGCATCVHGGPWGDCVFYLMAEACQALADMQDRCARYAEEVMMLRERLKEANHE